MDPDIVFLSYLAILAVIGIVLAIVEKRHPHLTWNPSPAWFAALLVVLGPIPLQLYLAWAGNAPTVGFVVLCVVADIGMWLLAYFLRRKRRLTREVSSRTHRSGSGRED